MTSAAPPADVPGAAALGATPITRGRGWVRGPLWDGFFLHSALWLAPLLWFLVAFSADGDADGATDGASGGASGGVGVVGVVAFGFTLCFWIAHRLSSSYVAWCTSAYRPLLTAQRARFVWIPLVIVVAVLAVLLPGDDVLPWPRSARLVALVAVDAVVVTWHFAAQHHGVLSLYRLRAGQTRDARARAVDRAYALVVGGVVVVAAEFVAGNGAVVDVLDVEGAGIDPAALLLRALRWGATVVVVVGSVAWVVADRAVTLPRLLSMAGIALVVLTGLWGHPLVFLTLWTTQHWLAATGLAVVVAGADTAPDDVAGASRWYRFWHRVHRRPALLLVALVLTSVALFPVMDVEAASDAAAPFFGPAALQQLVASLASSPLAPLLLALGFSSAFVHYQLDRAVFRLSDPLVRRAGGRAFDAQVPLK